MKQFNFLSVPETCAVWAASSVTKSLSKNSINVEKEEQARDILNNDFMLWVYPGFRHVSKVTIYYKVLASLGLSERAESYKISRILC